MGDWEADGRRFLVRMASDVMNDGMGLELSDEAEDHLGPLIEVFFHDATGRMDFWVHRPGRVPFEIIERFVAAARKDLPPTSK